MDQASTLRACYRILEDNANRALQTQVGDSQRLNGLQDEALQFLTVINTVRYRVASRVLRGPALKQSTQQRQLFPDEEFRLIMSNLREIVRLLDQARNQTLDPPNPPHPPPSYTSHTGRAGRPRVEIDQGVLSNSLLLEPKTTLATILGCSARTIRRRQQEIEDKTGIPLCPQKSLLSDEEVDKVVEGILVESPGYGRSMVMGAMAVSGHNVPERRVRESLDRVRGVPARFLGSRPIHRRKYFVPAANSLWHHDGQHGMLSSDLR